MQLFKIDQARSTPAPTPAPYVSMSRTSRPLPKTRANFLPAKSWLGYEWTDKDPELDMVAWAIEQSGWTCEKIEQETERHGHKVSRGTIYNWLYGDTRRPQNVTMNTVMAVLGYERQWKQK